MAQASSAAGVWRGASAGVLPPAPARTAARSSGRVRWLASERGSALVDFAILAPVLVLLLVLIVESALLLLGQILLQNAVGDAARSGIVGSALDAPSREALVRRAAQRVAGSLLRPEKLHLDTLVYPSFDDIGRPEPFVDVNGNGVRDAAEPFRDVNGNGRWDADMGRVGLGGPNDVVLYRVRYEWQPMTPLVRHLLPGGSLELRAAYAVRNEPFPES